MFDPSRIDDLKFIRQEYAKTKDTKKREGLKKIGLGLLNTDKDLVEKRAYMVNAARRGDVKTVKEISNYLKKWSK